MRALGAAFAICVLCLLLGETLKTSQAADTPFVVHLDHTNKVTLPEKVQKLWLFVPGLKGFPNGLTIPRGSGTDDLLLFPSVAPTIAAGRSLAGDRWSSISQILIDDLPATNVFSLEGSLMGSLREGETIRVPFSCNDGKPLCFEVVANRLGSKLDPIIRILDSKDGELAQCDDHFITGRDPRLVFTPPNRGSFTLELRDIANAGGSDFFFYIRSRSDASPNPDSPLPVGKPWVTDSGLRFLYRNVPVIAGTFLRVPDGQPRDTGLPASVWEHFESSTSRHVFRFSVPANQKIILTAKTREIGSPCDARLRLLDSGKKVLGESVGNGPDSASLTNRFEKAATILLEVTEISRLHGPYDYWLTIDEAKPGVVLTTEIERTDFSKEGEAKIKIACKRYDYEGPVKLRFDGLPEGVEVVDGVIPEKKNEVEVKLKRGKSVEAFQVRIYGAISLQKATKETKGEEEFPVSTMPALKKLFPLQMFPNTAMDGWIAVNPPN